MRTITATVKNMSFLKQWTLPAQDKAAFLSQCSLSFMVFGWKCYNPPSIVITKFNQSPALAS